MAGGETPLNEGKELAYDRARELRRRMGLEKGRQILQANKVVRKLVKEGRIDGIGLIAGTLDDTDEINRLALQAVAGWRIESALRAVPGIGPSRCLEILMTLQAGPNARIRDLSPARRAELARYVRVAIGKGGAHV